MTEVLAEGLGLDFPDHDGFWRIVAVFNLQLQQGLGVIDFFKQLFNIVSADG